MFSPAVSVPDALWRDWRVSDRAKMLWCYLRTTGNTQLSFKQVRQSTGFAQNSILKYLQELSQSGWLDYRRSRHSFTFKTIWKRGRPAFRLPVDLICDREIPAAAKLIWGAITRFQGAFGYDELIRQTRYSRNTLAKYVNLLLRKRWLRGDAARADRKKRFRIKLANPHHERRQADLDLFHRAKKLAKKRIGDSIGQLYATYMTFLLVPEEIIISNAQPWGLVNPRTGAKLQYDILLPRSRVAIEFQGPQHDRPTELYPDEAQFRAQQERDRLKRKLSTALGIRLIEVRAEDLSFERLAQLLREAGVPLRAEPRTASHLYELLEKEAAAYRAAVAGLACPGA